MRASERQRASDQQLRRRHAAWPGNAMTVVCHALQPLQVLGRLGDRRVDLGSERRQLRGVTLAEGAAEIPRVDTLHDAGELPETEGDVEVELGQVPPGHVGVAGPELA